MVADGQEGGSGLLGKGERDTAADETEKEIANGRASGDSPVTKGGNHWRNGSAKIGAQRQSDAKTRSDHSACGQQYGKKHNRETGRRANRQHGCNDDSRHWHCFQKSHQGQKNRPRTG